MNSLRHIGALAVILLATPASATDRLLLAGGEAADLAWYSYVGTILPLGKRGPSGGFEERLWLDNWGYEYDGAPGRVRARALGAEAALGYSVPWDDGWASVSAGLRYTHTQLSPDDPGADARGNQLGVKLQVSGEHDVGARWRAQAIASCTLPRNTYWARLRLMHPAPWTRGAAGGEVIAGGNNESSSTALGGVAEFHPGAAGWSIGLRAGYRFQHEADGVYGGIEIGFGF